MSNLLNRIRKLEKLLPPKEKNKKISQKIIEVFCAFKPDYRHPEGSNEIDLNQLTEIESYILTGDYYRAFDEFLNKLFGNGIFVIGHNKIESKCRRIGNLWRFYWGYEKNLIFTEEDYRVIDDNIDRFYNEYYQPLRRLQPALSETITGREFLEELLPEIIEYQRRNNP